MAGSQMGAGVVGVRRANQGPELGVKIVRVGALGVGYQTGDWVPDKGWGSRQGVGFQTGDGVPDMGDGVSDME